MSSAAPKQSEQRRQRLTEVGLAHRATHRAGELPAANSNESPCQSTCVRSRSVLLADEPTGSLDFRTGETIIGLLYGSPQGCIGLTSIFVTHNLSFASRCDRVLELRKGSSACAVGDGSGRKPELDKTQPVLTVALMFERYTEKARRVIFFARYEASQFGSPYIETEHLLLGLLARG